MSANIRSQWESGRARIVHQSNGGAGMRRSIKTDKLLGSSAKTFTIKDCLVYRAGVLLNEHGTVRRANLADGVGTYNGLSVRAIGGNSNGYTQVWSVIA